MPQEPSSVLQPLSLLDLSADDLLCVLRFAGAPVLARCRATCTLLKQHAEDEELWEKHCKDAGLSRNGSSRPKSRTYCSWRQSWMDGRCVECGDTYTFKVNLDGGSTSACLWHGAKVALCQECACVATFCYQQNASNVAERHMSRLYHTYAPEGWFVARICGRNLEAMLQHAGIKYDKWLEQWRARGQESVRAARLRLAAESADPCSTPAAVAQPSPRARKKRT